MSEEKRRSPRIKKDFHIFTQVYKKTELEGSIGGISDISTRGLCFLSDTRIAQYDVLKIIFRIPPECKEKIELFGQVVKTEPIEGKAIKVRVAFIEMPPDTKASLEALINQTCS